MVKTVCTISQDDKYIVYDFATYTGKGSGMKIENQFRFKLEINEDTAIDELTNLANRIRLKFQEIKFSFNSPIIVNANLENIFIDKSTFPRITPSELVKSYEREMKSLYLRPFEIYVTSKVQINRNETKQVDIFTAFWLKRHYHRITYVLRKTGFKFEKIVFTPSALRELLLKTCNIKKETVLGIFIGRRTTNLELLNGNELRSYQIIEMGYSDIEKAIFTAIAKDGEENINVSNVLKALESDEVLKKTMDKVILKSMENIVKSIINIVTDNFDFKKIDRVYLNVDEDYQEVLKTILSNLLKEEVHTFSAINPLIDKFIVSFSATYSNDDADYVFQNKAK